MEELNAVRNFFFNIFSEEKIKMDVLSILKSESTSEDNAVSGSFKLSISNGDSKEIVEIGIEDKFTAINIGYNTGSDVASFIPLTLRVGIGDYESKFGIYKFKKCIMYLQYNHLFELVLIDEIKLNDFINED